MKTTLLKVSLLSLAIAAVLSGCLGDGGGTTTTTDPFVFSTASADSGRFVRIDRTGQPAIATALFSRACPTDPGAPVAPCTSGTTIVDAGGMPINPGNQFNVFNDQRDQFNRGEPNNDVRDFAGPGTTGPQANSLQNIHFETRPFLVALGLTPCSTEIVSPPATRADIDISVCVAQVQTAPIFPDVMAFDANVGVAAGWPNGRHFDDPVVDRILAAALLRISGVAPPHTINSLVGVINTWNGPSGAGCVAPCAFTGDETLTVSPATFPYLRTAQP